MELFRLAISATFTAEPIEPVLAFWGRTLESPFDIRFTSYNQPVQALIDPSSEFSLNRHGVNILLIRLEDLAQFDAQDPAIPARIEGNLRHLVDLIRTAPQRMTVPLIVALCPPSPAFLADAGRAKFVHETAMHTEAMLDETPGVQCLTHEEIQRLYPVPAPSSPEGDRLGHIPYTDLYFCALGTALVRMAHGLFLPPYKAIALDCDYTLWKGICGEDGPQGITIDPPRRALQEFMCDQHEAGMLLAMASKNNERDVFDTFEQNPGMPLQLRHFIASRLNWEPKGENLASLASELSLGLDSFIFVDDNPKECAEVEESAPEALALVLPQNASGIPDFLQHVWAFDHLTVTDEDRHRNAYYSQASEFGHELRKIANLEHFLETLELRVSLEGLAPDRLNRVAQLIARTNQFSFTTKRRTGREIQTLVDRGDMECLTVNVSDRFGDYGLVGVILFGQTASAIEIDTLLLSCRVLGRGVEHRLMSHLADVALRQNFDTVVATLLETNKNQPARQFLHEIGAAFEERIENGFRYRFPAPALRGLEWKPSSVQAVYSPAPVHKKNSSTRKRPDYALIATKLSTPAQVLEAMRFATPADATMTEIESRLARIWSDLLHRPGIAPDDNFFDLGGHSLLAVLLIMRVRDAFGVELPIDDVYSAGVTLGELASKIEAYQLGNPADYDALLKEIEALSDEEVDRLLAEEEIHANSSDVQRIL